jgi:uncharacterized protein with PIN domain
VVIDTSALIAILLGEPERDRFIDLLVVADDPPRRQQEHLAAVTRDEVLTHAGMVLN